MYEMEGPRLASLHRHRSLGSRALRSLPPEFKNPPEPPVARLPLRSEVAPESVSVPGDVCML
jgi:hypothetical protein